MDARPPFDPTKPVEGFLRISADGQWLYQGEPITHPGLVNILESNFIHDEEGRYLVLLKLPMGTQKVAVEFEDTPYFVRDVETDAEEGELVLNDATREPLRPELVAVGSANGRTYARVKAGKSWARFTRQAELRLASLVEERGGALGLTFQGQWSPLSQRNDR